MTEATAGITEAAARHASVLTEHAQYLITTAGRAPSVHNSQPWRFHVSEHSVELWADPQRKVAPDALGREMLISCGAALFGLRLAIRSLGWQPRVKLLPDKSRLRLVARVTLGEPAEPTRAERQLLAAVPLRHTHRGAFTADRLPPGLLAGLQSDTLAEGATLALVEHGLPFDYLSHLAAIAAHRGDRDPANRSAVAQWTRPYDSPQRDGIPATAFPASAVPGNGAREPGALAQRDFDLGRHLGLIEPGQGAPPAATGVLLTGLDRRSEWLRAGQALQRLLLHAASQWVFARIYTQPVEDPVTRVLIRSQLGLTGHPQLILQFGHAGAAVSTPRRTADEVTD